MINFKEKDIETFNRDGFIVLKKFTDTDRCDKIIEKAKYHLANKIEPFESEQEYLQQESNSLTLRRLRQVYDREDIFKEWMLNSEIIHIAKMLLGENINLVLAHHNSIMTKMPHESSETYWHQDIRYWNYENDNLISIWLSLDSEYLENGLLEFIPGSHKMHFKPEQFDEHLNFREDIKENIEIIEKKVHTNLEKGDVVIFHAKTLHHANKNITDKAKISFVYTIKQRENRAVKGTRSDAKEIELNQKRELHLSFNITKLELFITKIVICKYPLSQEHFSPINTFNIKFTTEF